MASRPGWPCSLPLNLGTDSGWAGSVNGQPPAFRSWEDTVNLPPRSRVRIAWKADDRVGEWMYHCHILEHHQSGMMAHFEAVP
jgi:FtsP/CotA-like multicopper oxidase with cupredoxin domain